MDRRQQARRPPETPQMSPLFNDAFLRIFGSQDSERVTLSLVNAVLAHVGLPEIEHVESLSTDATVPGGAHLKSPRLDVVLRADGRVVDLELEQPVSQSRTARAHWDNSGRSPGAARAGTVRVVG